MRWAQQRRNSWESPLLSARRECISSDLVFIFLSTLSISQDVWHSRHARPPACPWSSLILRFSGRPLDTIRENVSHPITVPLVWPVDTLGPPPTYTLTKALSRFWMGVAHPTIVLSTVGWFWITTTTIPKTAASLQQLLCRNSFIFPLLVA